MESERFVPDPSAPPGNSYRTMNKAQCGVTLVEILVVLTIVAIVTVYAVPAWDGASERKRLARAGDGLRSDIQYARSESLRSNTTILISVEVNGGDSTAWCYGLDDDGSNACDCNASPGNCTIDGVQKVVNNGHPPGSDQPFPGISLTTNLTDNDTGFEPVRGTALESGVLTLAATDGNSYQVAINNSGRVKPCSSLPGYPDCGP